MEQTECRRACAALTTAGYNVTNVVALGIMARKHLYASLGIECFSANVMDKCTQGNFINLVRLQLLKSINYCIIYNYVNIFILC